MMRMMRTFRSKYNRGDLKNKWKIQQCQCEKVYFDYHKDCQDCEGRFYCYTQRFKPYFVNVTSSMLIFADSFENAKDYAEKGHGWLVERESTDGFPVELKVGEKEVNFVPDFEREEESIIPARF